MCCIDGVCTGYKRTFLADSTTSRVSFTLDSSLDSVNKVEQTAEQYAGRAGFDEDTVQHIAMAVREAAVNAVLHGNAYDKTKHITASFETTSDSLIIRITDQGPGLDPDSIPDPLAPENILRGSGRGIFLIRAFMDEVNFRQLHPGTELTLIKHRTPAQPGDLRRRLHMSMKVQTRQVDGITILDLSGRITLGEGSVTIRDAVRDVLAKGSNKILLNLGEITYIDSSGIGELVSAFTTVRNSGGELKLLNLTKKVHDLLQITKLYTVFDVKDDEASAISSFSK